MSESTNSLPGNREGVFLMALPNVSGNPTSGAGLKTISPGFPLVYGDRADNKQGIE